MKTATATSLAQFFGAGTFLVSAALAGPAMADCTMVKLGTLPVEIVGNRPFIRGQINGHDIYVLADTGAEVSLVWASAAERAGLRPVHEDAKLYNIAGEAQVKSVNIAELKLGDFTVRDKRWPVVGRSVDADNDFGMVLGSDFFSKLDVEFDLANGQIILWEPRDCKKVALAHWNKDFMLAKLSGWHKDRIEADAVINGRKVHAELDTGASFSTVSIGLAHALGFREDAADVKAGPNLSPDSSDGGIPSYIMRFDTFELGDMTVKNARLLVADLHPLASESDTGTRIRDRLEMFPDLVIGADFFLANHVYVANSQDYLYFTYNGGKIFQIEEAMRGEDDKQPEGSDDGKD